MNKSPYLVGLFLSVGACSALIDPDPSLLGDPVAPMECPTDCDDGVACTIDRCEGAVCVNERDNSQCADSERCDMVMGCIDASCTGDADCDDGLACNGVETCSAGRCQEGAAVVCNDGLDCTVDRCDEDSGTCRFETDNALCDDGVDCTRDSCTPEGCQNEPDNSMCDDGFCFQGAECTPAGCAGGMALDCNDGDVCTIDMCDPDAMMCMNIPSDGDNDGFSTDPNCSPEVDCDDGDDTIFPGAREICDDIDQDCDGDNTDGCEPVLPNTCESAQLLEVPGGAPVSVNGSFMGYEDNYSTRCAGETGPDAVFLLNIDAGSDYIIDTVGSEADTILAVSPDCGDWQFAQRGCNDDITRGNRSSRIYLRRLGDAGVRQIYILVDEYPSAVTPSMQWVLNVRAVPASGLQCGGRVDISEGGSVVGFISPSAPSQTFSTCQSGVGTFSEREAYFRIRPQRSDVRVQAWSEDFEPSLAALRACGGLQSSCDQGDSGDDGPDLRWNANREEYVIVIDGADGSEGNFYTLEYDP